MMPLHYQDQKEFLDGLRTLFPHLVMVSVLHLVQSVRGFVVKGVGAGGGCVVIAVGMQDATGMMIAVKEWDFSIIGVCFQ